MSKRVTGTRTKLAGGQNTRPVSPPAFLPVNKQESGKRASSRRINRTSA